MSQVPGMWSRSLDKEETTTLDPNSPPPLPCDPRERLQKAVEDLDSLLFQHQVSFEVLVSEYERRRLDRRR